MGMRDTAAQSTGEASSEVIDSRRALSAGRPCSAKARQSTSVSLRSGVGLPDPARTRATAATAAEERYRMTSVTHEIDPDVAPSGTGCAECLAGASPGWWLHLRRCAACGHIGCCDNSPSQHATAHHNATGHPVLQSFEPGEDWFFDYRSGDFFEGPVL